MYNLIKNRKYQKLYRHTFLSKIAFLFCKTERLESHSEGKKYLPFEKNSNFYKRLKRRKLIQVWGAMVSSDFINVFYVNYSLMFVLFSIQILLLYVYITI